MMLNELSDANGLILPRQADNQKRNQGHLGLLDGAVCYNSRQLQVGDYCPKNTHPRWCRVSGSASSNELKLWKHVWDNKLTYYFCRMNSWPRSQYKYILIHRLDWLRLKLSCHNLDFDWEILLHITLIAAVTDKELILNDKKGVCGM